MDGLLLATEQLALDLFEAACRAHGIAPNRSIYYRCIGTRDETTRRIIQDGYGPSFPYEKVHATWMRAYHDHVLARPVPARPGAAEILALTESLGLKVALATSTRRSTAERKLALAGFDRYFDCIVGGDEVARGKPDPDPYLIAAERLGVYAPDCWAIEDSDNGVRSAHGAGMWVIQVPDLLPPGPDVADLGHCVLPSLDDVSALLRTRGL